MLLGMRGSAKLSGAIAVVVSFVRHLWVAVSGWSGWSWWSWWRRQTVRGFAISFGVLGAVSLCLWLFWGADGRNGTVGIGTILEAQASLVGIAVAAMIFVVEVIQRRERADPPVFERILQYVWARSILGNAIVLLAMTASFFVVAPLAGVSESDARRLAVVALAGLLFSAGTIAFLILRAIQILEPGGFRRAKDESIVQRMVSGAEAYTREESVESDRADLT